MQQPPIIIECPVCSEKYLISPYANNPSENAMRYSDGYYTDEKIWRTPTIIGCVTCELGFFPENGNVIDESDWQSFNEKWSHLKQAAPPTAGTLVIELRARKNMDAETEKKIRLELWYSGIHTEMGRLLMARNTKFLAFWNESLKQLEALLKTNELADLMLKTEINRQLGNFEKSISLLEGINTSWANQIRSEAGKKNRATFVLS
jgi:hypothetical protein